MSGPNYHTTTQFSENSMAIDMKKTEIVMNKPIYLGQTILDISKTPMYEFCYDHIKPKYRDKAKLCYMDTGSFFVHIKTKDFYKDIANDVDKWFDISACNENDKRPLPIGINKKVLEMFKDELNGKAMTKFCAPRGKTYAYSIDCFDDDDDDYDKNTIKNENAKGTKKCVIKHHLRFDHYKDSIFNDKKILRQQQRFKSDLYTI